LKIKCIETDDLISSKKIINETKEKKNEQTVEIIQLEFNETNNNK